MKQLNLLTHLATSHWQRFYNLLLQNQQARAWQRRHIFLLLIIACTTLTVSATAVISYSFIRGIILNNLKEIALLKVERGSDEIDRWLSGRKAEISILANDPKIRSIEWLETKPRMQLAMDLIGKDFFNLSMIQPDGSLRSFKNEKGNIKDRKHFQLAMAGKLNVSDPLISRAYQAKIIVIATPLMSLPPEPKQVIGVLAGSISIERVTQIVSNLQYGNGSYAFALNSKGVPIVHPDKNLIGNLDKAAPSLVESKDASLAAIAREMVKGKSNIEFVKIDGNWVYIAYDPLDEANWSTALVIPRQNLESQLWPLNLLAAVVGSILFIATIAAIWLVYSSEKNRAQAEREALLNRIGRRIRASLNLDQILQTTVEEVVNLLDLEKAVFSRYDSEQNSLEILAEYCKSDKLKQLGKFQNLLLENLPARLQKSEGVILRRKMANPENSQPLELKANSYLAVPVRTQNDTLGYLICCHNVRWLSIDGEFELLQAVADQLAIAITQSHLYSQTQEQVKLLDNALNQLQKTQIHLVQSEKMSSLGQMVAGIAHEINNPVNFIFGNLPHICDYVGDLLELVHLYQQNLPALPTEIEKFEADIDLEFLAKDLPQILSSMRIGTERIRDLVLSLRNFSRLDEMDKKQADIHEGIENTLLLLSHRLKHDISVVKDYGKLPLIECYPSGLNQVFMNLLNNGIDALLECDRADKVITISTAIIEEDRVKWLRVAIADNGPGIPDRIKDQIFNPFFTTKPIGKGTGLGLAISYQIVVDTHGGKISVLTPPNAGTEFIVQIPIASESNDNHYLKQSYL
ncbi:MAG TPA: ATP-binding protein [Kamptonema sp.]|nr:ATP-binding protein [Kamptonema sp.]